MPSDIAKLLAPRILGRRIDDVHCVGCGKPVDVAEFRDECSLREWHISNFCQKCQDRVYGKNEL